MPGWRSSPGAATPAERALLEHRLLSFLPVDATFSAGQYAQLAHAEIDELCSAGATPIVVGGTGLYLRAALTELSLRPAPAHGIRERWLTELESRGPQALHAILARRAPWAAAEIEPTDRQRIVRALELLDAGELEPPQEQSELWSDAMRQPTLLIGLVMERERLYRRIDARVDQMLADGVVEEVRRASAAGASLTARKALGFEELLAGDVDATKRRTRNYAAPAADVDAQARRRAPDRHDRSLGGRRGSRDRTTVAGRLTQKTGTNGYMSTAATTTETANRIVSNDTNRRRSRHAHDAR